LEKCDNTKFEGVELQDEGAPFVVSNLHHKDVVSMSNVEMTPEAVFHSFVRLEARKTWSCPTP